MQINHPGTAAVLEYEPVPNAKGSVLILPGGGYRFVSPREGAPVARAFAAAGWQSFVLKYGVDGGVLGVGPLLDAAWAVRQAREEADGLGFGGLPLAVCGFSAGGHLAASLGVHWNNPETFSETTHRRLHRPDAMILCYPVISAGEYRHPGSISRLVGEGDTAFFSLENHVSAETPPAFLWHTVSDESVPVKNSQLFAEALMAHHIPVEMHLYPFGPHGMSLATPEVNQPEEGRLADPHVAGWFGICLEWLEVVFSKERE